MTTPSLKLTYFNFKARAEPIRLALAISKIPFTDDRIQREQWPALKPTLPFHQLPVLTVDGTILIAQSLAILRYVGKLGPKKLYPDDPLHAAVVDQVIGQCQDIENPTIASMSEPDAEKKMKTRVELKEKVLPPLFAALDAFIAARGGAFVAGQDVSVADLVVYQMNTYFTSGNLDGIPVTLIQGYPHIQKVVAAVKAIPAVAEWEAAHA
ncbi:hypothetical protein HDU98_010906 [Podochytrium sp. JEL0797]|nr:hypothetical protein HDU98_010906 [Podochytrium sp. JEL0797]